MLDVDSVLQKMESMGLIRLNKPIGDYYSVYCPIHKEGKERKPSCGVARHDMWRAGKHIPAGFCHCFQCSLAKPLPDTITEILKMKGINSKSGLDWLKENVPGFEPEVEMDMLVPAELKDKIEGKFTRSNNTIERLKEITNSQTTYVSEEELQKYRYTCDYMYKRRMTDEVIELYDVGFDQHWVPKGRKNEVPCITIPIRDINGRTLFFCRRSIEGKIYNYPEGVVKPVFGIDVIPKDTDTVIICESAINAITCHVYGYQAVALLGTGNSYQIKQLRRFGVPRYVICLDPDDAGRKGAAKLKKQLSDIALINVIEMPEGKDVNDCTKEEFDNLYNKFV